MDDGLPTVEFKRKHTGWYFFRKRKDLYSRKHTDLQSGRVFDRTGQHKITGNAHYLKSAHDLTKATLKDITDSDMVLVEKKMWGRYV